MRSSLFVFFAVLALSGCNTMFQEQHQQIVIDTPGVENADCSLQTKTNRYRVLSPRPVLVQRSRQALTVTCEKVNYYTGVVTVDSKIHMAPSQLNIFNGLIPGTAYDIADNSIYDYPDVITVVMKAKPESEIDMLPPVEEYVLPKKAEPVKTAPPPPPAAEQKAKVEEAVSKGAKK